MLPLLLACAAGPSENKDDSGRVTDTSTSTSTSVPCETDASVTVVSATPSTPWTSHELAVDVALSGSADVALRCVLDGDPDEVHLVESSTAATTHQLRLPGLLADATYDCAVAAVCPSSAEPLRFTHTTRSGARAAPEVDIPVAESGAGSEYILMNAAEDCDWELQYSLVFDRAGRVRWYYTLPEWVGPSIEFVYHGENRFAWGGGWEPNSQARPRLVDLYDGEVYDSAQGIPDYEQTQFHHDGKRVADGRWVTLEEVTVRGPSGSAFRGFQTRIVDPELDEVVMTYDSQRGIDEGHLPGGYDDAWHANWVDVVTQGDHQELLVNLCYEYLTLAVDAASGDWLWGFGRGGDFRLLDTEGRSLPDSEFPQCQHGLQRVGDRLLVYDNGFERGYSRAVEYTLDTTAMTATQNWTWTEDDWYETTLGSVDYLPSGHILVGAGHAECFSSNPGDRTTTLEFDPESGEKLWELRYAAVDEMAYRADWADPCELFANGKYCPEVAARAAALAPLFE